MYLLLKMVIFQPAMLVFRGVAPLLRVKTAQLPINKAIFRGETTPFITIAEGPLLLGPSLWFCCGLLQNKNGFTSRES